MSNNKYNEFQREKEVQYYSQAVQDEYRLPDEYYHPVCLFGLRLSL